MRRLLLHAIVAFMIGAPSFSLRAAPTVPDDVWCGTDFWFTMDEPAHWKEDWDTSSDQLVFFFVPEEQTRGDASVVMEFRLFESTSISKTDVRVDVEQALHRWISLLSAVGGAREIRSFGARHPSLPTAGAFLDLGNGRLYVVAVNVRSGRGNYFVATLGKEGGVASDAELALFRATIASIRFDPRRGCTEGEDGRPSATSLPGPVPAAATASPAAAPAELRRFHLGRAAAGCSMLNKLFIPVYCRMAVIEGEQAALVVFDDDDGPESAVTYLERFRERVAAPFCYEARRNPKGAPQLVFHAENSPRAGVYDCMARRVVRSVPFGTIGR